MDRGVELSRPVLVCSQLSAVWGWRHHKAAVVLSHLCPVTHTSEDAAQSGLQLTLLSAESLAFPRVL